YSPLTSVPPSCAILCSSYSASSCAARAAWPDSSSRANVICVGQKYCRKNPTTSFGGKGNTKLKFCRIQLISFAFDPKRWRTTASSPHSTGGGSGGGGIALAVMAKFFPTKPSGVQFAIATIPPGPQ